jgi:CelD/BcsL family acetyltransferase involved in cellulose biosynthesis
VPIAAQLVGEAIRMPNVSLCAPHELGPVEIARWRELQRADPRLAGPFLCPEFALVLGRHRRDVRIAVLEDGPQIVGFLPYHRKALGVGRALGYGLANGQGLVHARDLDWRLGEVLAKCGLAVLEFDELLGHQLEAFRPRQATAAAAPFVDLSVGWDEWLRAKRAASDAVKTVQRKQRKLARETGQVTFDFDSKRRDNVALLMRWKSRQYRRTGRFDRFSRTWFVAAFEELTEITTADFSGVLSVLSVDGRPVALQQALYANGVLSQWFPAYDVAFARYSPGLICMLEVLRAGCERGVAEVDLGKGQARYKEFLKDGRHTVVEGWSERSSAVATLRRLQQGPRRSVRDFVLARPRVRRVARETLNDLGRLRATLRGE